MQLNSGCNWAHFSASDISFLECETKHHPSNGLKYVLIEKVSLFLFYFYFNVSFVVKENIAFFFLRNEVLVYRCKMCGNFYDLFYASSLCYS